VHHFLICLKQTNSSRRSSQERLSSPRSPFEILTSPYQDQINKKKEKKKKNSTSSWEGVAALDEMAAAKERDAAIARNGEV
jgi:hypothetical protein